MICFRATLFYNVICKCLCLGDVCGKRNGIALNCLTGVSLVTVVALVTAARVTAAIVTAAIVTVATVVKNVDYSLPATKQRTTVASVYWSSDFTHSFLYCCQGNNV